MRRALGLVLIVCCLVWGVFAAVDLKQTLDVDKTLRGMGLDLAQRTADAGDGQQPDIAASGENSLRQARSAVDRKAHVDEAELLVAAVGLLFGLVLVEASVARPRSVAS